MGETLLTVSALKSGSSKEWHYFHPQCGWNVCLWCSQLTTEIINQKQLPCTWQIAALPSLQGTCFIYTSSLVACWLITSQVQYLKVSCWHRLHLGFPWGSCILRRGRTPSHAFAYTAISLMICTSAPPSWAHRRRAPPWVSPENQCNALSWTRHLLCPVFSNFRTAVSQHTFRILNSQKAFEAGHSKWRSE